MYVGTYVGYVRKYVCMYVCIMYTVWMDARKPVCIPCLICL